MAELNTTRRELFRDIRAFLLTLFPEAGQQIVQAIQNNVPLPENAIVMTFLFPKELDYSVNTYSKAESKASVQNSVEQRLQLDFYGTDADRRSSIVSTMWRNEYACDNLKLCQPLYVQSLNRIPYINDSNMYEDRYILDLALQYNPEVTVPMVAFVEETSIDITPL